jgi:hypothetical protein
MAPIKDIRAPTQQLTKTGVFTGQVTMVYGGSINHGFSLFPGLLH